MRLTDLKWGLLGIAVLASCSDKKSEIDNPEGPQGSGSMTVMTPEESKVFLENTATDFLDKFDPEQQRPVIELAAYYEAEYGEYDLPANFELKESGRSYSPARFLHPLAKAAQGDIDALTRAANSYSYTIRFEQYTGIYEPDPSTESWVRRADSDDVVFQFKNKSGQPVVLKVSQSGGVSDIDLSMTDWDYEYDPETGMGEDVENTYKYYISLPKNITVTLTENGRELAKTVCKSSIDIDGHTISADVDAVLMDLRAVAKLGGTDSKVESRTEMYVNNEKLATAYATVEGSNLCNRDEYKKLADLEEDLFHDQLGKMIKSGDCGMDVMGEVQVYGQMSYYTKLPLDLDGAYYGWDMDDPEREKAQQACQQACDRLNKHIKAQLRYNNTKTDQATIIFKPYLYDEYSYWEYYPTAYLLFPDKTTYDIEKYFSNFTGLSGKFDSLIESYLNIWDQVLN